MTVALGEENEVVEDFLEHFGVKGMKWGRRKVRPDEAERKARFSPKAKKIALGTAAVAGALAVAYLANKHGGVKVSSLGGLTDKNSSLYQATVAGKRAANYTMSKGVARTKMIDIPKAQRALQSPQGQIMQRAAIGIGTKKLADRAQKKKAEADAAKADSDSRFPSVDQVRANFNDPNYVWEL